MPSARSVVTNAGAAAAFAALGDVTRLSLLTKLSDGRSRSISELSADETMTRQAIAKHLRLLEAETLVASERHGRETRFFAKPQKLLEMRVFLEDISKKWDKALVGLKAHIES